MRHGDTTAATALAAFAWGECFWQTRDTVTETRDRMNLVWAGLGALLGLWLANDRYLLGAALGCAVLLLLRAQSDLRRRLEQAEQALRRERTALPERSQPAQAPMADAASAVSADVTASVAPASPAVPAPPVTAIAGIERSAPPEPAARPAPPPLHAAAARAPTPPPPDALDRALRTIKHWFTEGNVPVKIGVLVSFVGVAAALRYAVAEGLFTLPIGLRLALIAAVALAGLLWGWRERARRPAFGLSVQGGAIGVLLLTVFAAYRLYALLPPGLSFALVVALVAGAAALAVLQRAMALAVLGFLGGYLAPVLITTGSANHVALFSYYAVLNAAVFAISWGQHWRLLNLIGFGFTFGVGGAWGARFYRPESFASVEPFLVLFFLFYVAIGLLYVLRQRTHRRPWLDGTLIFGTPLIAFPMQAALLHDQPMALAWSAVAVAALYASLVYWLSARHLERLLAEAYAALALGFVTLAVPLAFSAGTTASLWALEGAAAAWLGLRQQRRLSWLAGLALQLLAAGAYVRSELLGHLSHAPLLLNATWLGAAILGVSGILLARVHDRLRPQAPLPALLMGWGLAWWSLAGISQLELAHDSIARWNFAMGYLTASLLLAAMLRRWLDWARLGWALALAAGFGLLSVFWAADRFGDTLAAPTRLGWGLYAAAMLAALWSLGSLRGRSLAATHGMGLWTLVIAFTLHLESTVHAASGWRFMAIAAPLTLMTLGLWRRPQWLAWPRAATFEHDYPSLWFGLALPLLVLTWTVGLFHPGNAAPLPYLPVFNPLELSLIAIGALLWAVARARRLALPLRPLALAAAFAWVTLATLRAVHQLHGDPWSPALLDSGFSQTSLTVVWSLIGVIAWVAGSRRQRRPLWLAGALLMGVVLLKLVAIDRLYMGNLPGIVSFLAVGLLLVAVGYFAPSPPKDEEAAS